MKPKAMGVGVPPKRKRCWASLTLGIVLAGIALAAMRIDLMNNWAYGSGISHELGLVMALAALALTVLPAAAALLGRWDWLLRAGMALAVVLTVWAAVSAYAEKQGAQILARQASQATYETARLDADAARHEIEQARAEAGRITETATVADLEKLEGFHRAQIATETEQRGGCGKSCKDHESSLKLVLARMPDARAKQAALARAEAAQQRLDAAKGEAKAGPAEVSMLATMISWKVPSSPEDIARTIAIVTTGFAILVTLAMAMLMEQATTLIIGGLGVNPLGASAKAPVESREARPVGVKQKSVVDSAPELKPSTDSVAASSEDRINLFAKRCLGEGEISGAELQEAFAEWWRSTFPGDLCPSMVAVSRTLTSAGITKEKRGGRVRYSAGLKQAALV